MSITDITTADALLIVDAQKTFMPGGELPVPDGENIVAPLVKLIHEHGHEFGMIAFSRDWHPRDHYSFAEEPQFEDGSWPMHGVAGTENAQVHPQLIAACDGLPYIIVSKGMNADVEAYSAFDGFDLDSGFFLHEVFKQVGSKRLLVAGLAGEVCVKETVLAGRAHGYEVTLLDAGIRFLGDPAPALTEMRAAGATNNTTFSA